MSEKQPLLVDADPEQPAVQQLACRYADDRRRRLIQRHRRVAAYALLLIFCYTGGFGIITALGPFFIARPASSASSASTPLDGPLLPPSGPLCTAYTAGHGIKTYPPATYPLAFDGQHKFGLFQNTTPHDDYNNDKRQVHISGEVVVRKVAADKAPSVDVEALSNDDRIGIAYDYVEADQALRVIVDDRIWAEAESPGWPCIVVRATVWLPAVTDDSVHLKSLQIRSAHLGIQLLDDVNLVVDEWARLASAAGSITAARTLSAQPHDWSVESASAALASGNSAGAGYRFEAPSTEVKTVSGPISGPWTLLNRLHIASGSGSVHVAVAPEAVADDEVGHLHLSTVSGGIRFEEIARESNAKKTVQTVHPHTLEVSSGSGSINGSGSFARFGRLHSISGKINAALQPVALPASGSKAVLQSSSTSGSTELYLLDEAAGQPLDFLNSTHHAVSGKVWLHYPASWAGGIHLKTISSSLSVTGKGVHVQPGKGPRFPYGPRRVEAVKDLPKGDGDGQELSDVEVSAVSGAVRLVFL